MFSCGGGLRGRGCQFRYAFVVALAGVVGSVALGVPVLTEPVTLTQPDGSTFVAVPGGDEWFNWFAYDGLLLAQDGGGWWCYAHSADSGLEPDLTRAGLDAPPDDAATVDDLPALVAAVKRPEGVFAANVPLTTRSTNRPVLVVLVEFQDLSLSTSDAYWSNLFFGSSGKTVRTYYEEVSGGDLVLIPAQETSGTANDGVVRVQLGPSDHNSGNHPNPAGTIDDRNRWIVYDALNASDSYVSYGTFDTNTPNGWLTPDELHIVTVVAGYERGYGDTLTPAVFAHRWALGFAWVENVPAVVCDSVTLCDYIYGAGYAQLGEWHGGHSATIGVPCHELGHDMGLVDLYDTSYASSGIGGYGVMSFGNWGQASGDAYYGETPTHMCAWSKAQLGFVTPEVASGNTDYTVTAAGSSSYNAVRVNTSHSDQYFLIENRQLQGFDQGLYRWFSATSGGTGGGGLAIWHVDEAVADNSTVSHKKVDLEEANEGYIGYSELDGLYNQGNRNHLYFAGHITLFGDATTPNSKLYNGGISYVNLSSITASGPTMKCYVATEPSTTRTLEWSTFLGGGNRDGANGIAIDQSDNIYVVGGTNSADFPTTPGAYDDTVNGYGALFVSKFSSGGTLIHSTLFDTPGATLSITAYNVAVDADGCAYVTGPVYGYLTTTVGAYDTTYGGYGHPDGFVTKFDASLASLEYSTYLGGSNYDVSWDIAVDASGNAHVTGGTASSDFPATLGSYGDGDVFVTKFNTTGTGLVYSRLFGAQSGGAHGITVDASSNSYVCGYIYTSTFPTTTGAYDTSHNNPGYGDAFVTKLGSTGSIDYSTFLGGYAQDQAEELEVDSLGYVYVTGYTSSSDFPSTPGVYDTTYNARGDVYVTKLHPTAYSGLTYSTFVGTDADKEYAYGIDIDSSNNAYAAGYAQGLAGTDSDEALLYGLDPAATSLLVNAYFGGTARDDAMDMAVDSNGAVYLVGFTESSDFAVTPGAHDTSFGGDSEAFVLKYGWGQVTSSLVVGLPDGAETWCLDDSETIQWSSSGAGGTVKIELSRNGSDGTWETLYASTANDGSEDWTVTGAESSDCYIRIADTSNGSLTDISNTAFTIMACSPAPDPPTIPVGEPGYDKIRYISFVPSTPGVQTAIRVTLTTMPPPYAGFSGQQMWVGEALEKCENGGVSTPPCPPVPLIPASYQSANLQCTPHCMDFGAVGALHVTDDEIIPNAVYDVQMIDCSSDPGNEANYSDPLTIYTSTWADLVKDCTTTPCGPPDGSTGIVDVTAILDKFKNLPAAVMKSRADIDPNLPDWLVNITDVTFCLDAFLGFTYPPFGWTGPGGCGPMGARVESYSNSGCLGSRDQSSTEPCVEDDVIELTPSSGTLDVIHWNASYNCCQDDIKVSSSLEGSLLSLTEEEVPPGGYCDCICCFNVEATIVDLPAGTYTVEYCWLDYEQNSRCHTDDIVIP